MYLTSLTIVIVVVVVMSFQYFQPPSKLLADKENSYPALAKSSKGTTKLNKLLESEKKTDLPQRVRTKSTGGSTPDLTLPFSITLQSTELLQQQWVGDLKRILEGISPESPPVHIIAGNYKYREVLLNWLISAKVRVNPPLTNIIVLSIDSPLCDLLNKRNVTCVHAHWKEYLIKELTSPFAAILVLRITAIRLLNYWGYDAANIDTDALILKNPEPLYEEFSDSDLVAGYGRFPFDLGSKWRETICGGAVMIRSTLNSGILHSMIQ